MANLKSNDHKGIVTLEDLNREYGDFGRTFDTKKDAENYSKKLGKPNYITRLKDYKEHQVEVKNGIGVALEGAISYCKGYLVTTINN